MDVVKQRAIEGGFSEQAAKFVASARRVSTTKTYNYRINKFAQWCERRDIDPFSASVQHVADFICHLYEVDKLVPSTLAAYKSALASVIPSLTIEGVENDTLNEVIKGMSNLRPRQPIPIPSWNLSLVLQVLGHAPFEPIRSIDIKLLTIKSVFLVAAASARRRSEIHALSAEQDRFVVTGEGLRLLPRLCFLAKNQSLKYPGQPINLPSLTRHDPNSCAWCPVRCLKMYKKRTSEWRDDPKSLWLCLKAPHLRASKDTISRWIVDAIQMSHKIATGKQIDRANAHEVRALAASSALYKGVSLEQVMSVAQWHAESSFTDFYLRDISSTLNPVAVANLSNLN
jgi:hypothetical protein